MKFIVKNVFIKKVLVIFLIGLVCRVGLNLVFDIDIFKDLYSLTSFVGYGFMVCSSIVVYELPDISFNNLKYSVIRDANLHYELLYY